MTPPEHDPPGAGLTSPEKVAGARGEAEWVGQRSPGVGTWVWLAMMIAIVVEFAVGVAALVAVPVGRPNGWVPARGDVVYLVHAGLGGALTVAAMGLVLVAPRERIGHAGVLIGLAGLALAAGGGILSAYHPSRVAGLVLMLIGTLVAFFGYLMPLAEPGARVDGG